MNYQLEMEKIISENRSAGIKPTLLLHACCAPCSSYCLEQLAKDFDITVLYYNPNLYPAEEFSKRAGEEVRLVKEMNSLFGCDIKVQVVPFDEKEFYLAVKGLEDCREGGERCRKCFELRLGKTAECAERDGFDFFTTTLTISPLKNAQVLNEVGQAAGENYSVRFLPSDFKKKGGYQRSIVLSKQFGLYRQDYCGCIFSKKEREKALFEKESEK